MVDALGRIEILEWAEIISKINADILKGILNTGMSKDIKNYVPTLNSLLSVTAQIYLD